MDHMLTVFIIWLIIVAVCVGVGIHPAVLKFIHIRRMHLKMQQERRYSRNWAAGYHWAMEQYVKGLDPTAEVKTLQLARKGFEDGLWQAYREVQELRRSRMSYTPGSMEL